MLDARTAPLGILQLQQGRFHDALDALLGAWRDERVPRLACGMVGSRQGWVEAPYIACPAPLSALADGIAQAPGHALAIVPGVSTRDANGIPDVMRGEETQIHGAVDERQSRALIVLPGTHSKWACVDAGRIVDFTTFMTGELYAVLVTHSILGRLATPAPASDGTGPGFLRGVERGLGPGPTGHDLFGARTLALAGELPPEDVADWLSGFLVGREVRCARTWARQHGYDGARVRLVGEDTLLARYQLAFAQADIIVERGDAQAAARGLWRIAESAGMVSRLH